MNSSIVEIEARAQSVHCTDNELVVSLTDGRVLSIPLAWFPRLMGADAVQRAHFELLGSGKGIHWPDIDEDLSIAGLLAGRPVATQRAA